MYFHRHPTCRPPTAVQSPAQRSCDRAGPVTACLAASLAVAVFAGAAHPVRVVRADQIGQQQGRRSTLNLTIQQLQQQIADASDQEARLQGIIDEVNGQITQNEAEVSTAQDKLAAILSALGDAQDRLDATTGRLNRNRAELGRELVVSYKLGSQANALTAVFGSGDFNEGWQRLIAIRQISAAADRLVQTVAIERRQVADTVAQISDDKRQQAGILEQLQVKVDLLQGQLTSRRNAQVLQVRLQAQDTLRLQQAEQSAREVDAEIAALQAAAARARGGPAGGSGRFAWPETGPITQPFGCTPYPFEPYDGGCPSHHSHTGLDIGAAGGTRIGAADGGVAHIFVSSYGYGNHVIIDHGNGWVTVYGHLASFAVGEGQAVVRGQTVGYEGSTGNSTGPHLHFEIRSGSQPVNPLTYLP